MAGSISRFGCVFRLPALTLSVCFRVVVRCASVCFSRSGYLWVRLSNSVLFIVSRFLFMVCHFVFLSVLSPVLCTSSFFILLRFSHYGFCSHPHFVFFCFPHFFFRCSFFPLLHMLLSSPQFLVCLPSGACWLFGSPSIERSPRRPILILSGPDFLS